MLDYGRTASAAATMTSYTKAKRSHSMPSRYVMPREELGEYDTEPSRRRSAPARPSSGMLFPLSEEGTYGALPQRPPVYQIKERKPKVYSSYSVSDKCSVHGKNLKKQEKEWTGSENRNRRQSWSARAAANVAPAYPGTTPTLHRRSSASPTPSRRTVSASPSRSRQPSESGSTSSRARRRSGSPQNIANLYAERNSRKLSDYGATTGNKGYSGTSWATSSNYSSYSSNSNSSSGAGGGRKTSNSWGGNLRDTSFEENEEYEYEENQRRASATASAAARNARNRRSKTPENLTNLYAERRAKKYSEFIDRDGGVGDSYGRKNSDIGLNAMRKPKIHSWDNMGILGLTTKIWNDTKKRQETFMSSTGSFLREESSSYIM